MASKTMLTPRPGGSGAIARVLILSEGPDGVLVLDVDALHKNPVHLKRFNPGYTAATKFWGFISSLIVLAGVVLSFVWHWWAFLPGFALGFIIYRANAASTADFAIEAIQKNPGAIAYFTSSGLTWLAPRTSLVADKT
jgi:hypothetical protein